MVSIQDLGEVAKLDFGTEAAGASLKMHQARHVGRDDVLGLRCLHESQLVVAHPGRYGFFGGGECPAEAAAFVVTKKVDQLDSFNSLEKGLRLVEGRVMYSLAHGRHVEAADRRATVVESYFVREFGPGKFVYLQHVVEELDEIIDMLRDMVSLRAGRRGDELITDVVRAASGWDDDVLETRK